MTMTQEEKRALLAREVMGWHEGTTYEGWHRWYDRHGKRRSCKSRPFHPDELRDQLAEVEAALTGEQKEAYGGWIVKHMRAVLGDILFAQHCHDLGLVCWFTRSLPPAVCVDAIAEMPKGGK